MPVLSGLDAARCLKESAGTAAIPIVGLTAHLMSPERDYMRQLCDGFLTKPCHPRELVGEIGRVAGLRAAAAPH
jgi:CheY-like chemotaxis protein